ncbi:MAG TPA: FtsX-like permease family protein [Streptosporangiaceae bacterium]|nr:FtsX-like permease family protein [Streptosporangiaceae bacterium]
MGSLWLALRAGLRVRWRAMAGLAVLLGLIGGVVLTAAAGARRTDTAYPRLLRWANASQVNVISGGSAGFYQRLRRLPLVASVSVAGYYVPLLPAPNGRPRIPIAAYASLDGSWGVTTDRVKVLSGRLFDPADPHAAMIDRQLAARLHLRPGGTLRLVVVPNAPGTGSPEFNRAVTLVFRVSAIVVFDNQVVPATQANTMMTALLSEPFTRTLLAKSANYGYQAAVRLRPGASSAGFVRAVTALAANIPATRNPGGIAVVDLADQVAASERAITPQAFALAAFAGLAGLIALAVVVQLLGRQLILDSAEFPILRALGMTRGRLTALSLARLGVLTATGGVLAVAVAIAASPLMPIGPARVAEPSPGIEVNLAILATGFAAIAILPIALVAPGAWRAAGRPLGPLGVAEPGGPVHASRLGTALGLAGWVTSAIGVRMAFEPGRGRTAVPVRSAMLATILAVAAVVAAGVFGTGLVRLIGTPHLYGQNWQQELNLQFGAVDGATGARLMAAQPGLAAYAAGNYGRISVNGHVVPGVGIDPVRGGRFITLLAGRAPRRPGEIAFGTQTLREIHGHLGQVVIVLVNGRERSMRIVGIAVLPAFGQGTIVATNLGSGAVLPASVLSVPDRITHCTGNHTCYNFFLARYRPGTGLQRAAAQLHAATIRLGCPPLACSVISDQRPSDIRNYGSVRDTPLALGIALALLAVGTLTHMLLTSLRQRRRDLAMLKTLGLLRSQLLQVVSWQASALAAAALLAGLPLGVLAGRWAWVLFARSIGVGPDPHIEVLLVLAAVPVTFLLVNLVAVGPGWAAARIRPASVLRGE